VKVICPLCESLVETGELKPRPGTGGAECPQCGKLLRFHRPYGKLRAAVSLLIAALVVWFVGVRSLPIFAGITLVLWVPASLLVSAWFLKFLPLTLIPWTPRQRFADRDAPIELFDKKQR
jgi:uncharacterized protein (DUF983 family)